MSKIYIGKSKINNKGVFAAKFIQKREIIFIVKGRIKKYLTPSTPKNVKIGPNWLGMTKNVWLNPVKEKPYNFINHSCNPNAGIKGKVMVVALKDIKKNNEITFDYSISEDDLLWKIRCSCKQKNCRKIIRSIQFLPYKIYKRYLPYIPTYFKNVYIKHHKMQQ